MRVTVRRSSHVDLGTHAIQAATVATGGGGDDDAYAARDAEEEYRGEGEREA